MAEPERETRRQRVRRQVGEAAPDALFARLDEHGLRGVARRTDSYGFVLLMLVALAWIFVPFAGSERWAVLPTLVVFWLAIIIAMHTSFVRGRRLATVAVFDTTVLTMGTVGLAIDNHTMRGVADLCFALLLFSTAGVILRRVLSHTEVTSRTLSGAVSAWLFIGLGFATLYTAISLFDEHAYVAANGPVTFGSLLYFSWVTLATLGYGDIVPVSDFARSAASFEAIFGQIYLVIVVARLVSLLGLRQMAGDNADGRPEGRPSDPDLAEIEET